MAEVERIAAAFSRLKNELGVLSMAVSEAKRAMATLVEFIREENIIMAEVHVTFCDLCNANHVIFSSTQEHHGAHPGVYAGTAAEAIKEGGWIIDDQNQHVCPECCVYEEQHGEGKVIKNEDNNKLPK